MANIISSTSWDNKLAKSSSQDGSTETASSYAAVHDYEEGKYILLAQKHFNIDENDHFITRTTSRFVIVNVVKRYARTICISHLTAELWWEGNEGPELQEELATQEVKDPKGGNVIVKRIKKKFIPTPLFYKAPNSGYLPLKFSNGIFTIEKDVYLEMKEYMDGIVPAYEFKCTTPDGQKHFDVESDKDGYVVWNKRSVQKYDVLLEPVNPIDKRRALEIISGSAEISHLFTPLGK